MSVIAETFERLLSVASPAARWKVACDTALCVGGEWITAASAQGASLHSVSIQTSVPPELMQDYIRAGLPRRDRWLHHCARTTAIEGGDPRIRGSMKAGAFDPALGDLLTDYGVRFVALVPAGTSLHVEALVIYATCRDGAECLARASASGELVMLASLVTAFRSSTSASMTGEDHYRFGELLSPREREVLLWLASGLRTAEIAHRMGIESVTVGYHFQGARRKLGARTREQALAIALTAGHIVL